MSNLILKYADELGIQPAKIKGMEQHGLCYFIWNNDTNVAGGQCSCCNTIVWVNSRENPVLSEIRPSSVPSSGVEYRKYYQNNLNRFLLSLPPCPSCGETKYDRFINNVTFPRLADGTDFDDSREDIELVNSAPNSVKVWWLEGKKGA